MKTIKLKIKASDLRKKLNIVDGLPGEQGKPGTPADEQAIYERVMEMCQPMMDRMEKMIKIMANRPVSHAGGRANHAMKTVNLSAQTNGVLKVFSVPKSVTGFVISSDFPTILMENAGITFNTPRTQITLQTDNAPSTSSQLLYVYSEVFNT